jgi:DNA helicase-2/ATP-dependent DNA helicase PcrA
MNEVFSEEASSMRDSSVEEERRMAYVAMTRARDRLYLCAVTRDRHGNIVAPSRFLDARALCWLSVRPPH